MNAVVQMAGSVLLQFIWQGTAIAVATAILLELLAFRSARLRYAMACLSLAAMLASPVLTLLMLPEITREAGIAEASRNTGSNHRLSRIEPAGFVAGWPVNSVESSQVLQLGMDQLLRILVGAWALGVVALLARMAGGWWRVRHLHRRAIGCPTSRWQQTCERLAARMGIPRAIHVVESALVDAPTMIGWLRPVIVLPVAALAGLTAAQVEAILVHELAHIRRHDYLVNLLQAMAETLLFYHPAIWWISARIRAEREYCCDDMAVAYSGDALGYASALAHLEAARGSMRRLAMAASGGSLLDRVGRILRTPRNDSSRSPGWIITLVLTAFFVAGAGSVRWVPSISEPRGGAAVAEQLPAPQPGDAPSGKTLPMPAEAEAISLQLRDQRYRLRWNNGWSFRDVRGYGDVLFSDDLTDVKALANGGYLIVREWTSLLPRSVELRFNGRELTRKYYVAGFEKSWGPEAAQWLAERLPSLIRRLGLGAATRTRQILAARGVDGVFDEIGRLEGDYVRRMYFRELNKAQPPLDEKATIRSVELAGRLIDSDYYLAETLRETVPSVAGVPGGAKAYVEAADSLESDYERRRVLVALLGADHATADVTDLAMRSAAKMRSDYERAETLRAALREEQLGHGDAMFAAIETMRSDYEKRRVLATLVAQQTSIEVNRGLLKGAATIGSDYECAELLLSFIKSHTVDPTTRQAFFAAVATIDSNYERKRVLTKLVHGGGVLGPEIIRSVLHAVSTMTSDYERAETLLSLVKHQPLDTVTRGTLIDVSDKMRSDYEQGRVLVALVKSERR